VPLTLAHSDHLRLIIYEMNLTIQAKGRQKAV